MLYHKSDESNKARSSPATVLHEWRSMNLALTWHHTLLLETERIRSTACFCIFSIDVDTTWIIIRAIHPDLWITCWLQCCDFGLMRCNGPSRLYGIPPKATSLSSILLFQAEAESRYSGVKFNSTGIKTPEESSPHSSLAASAES